MNKVLSFNVCLIMVPLLRSPDFDRLTICSHENFRFVILENLT